MGYKDPFIVGPDDDIEDEPPVLVAVAPNTFARGIYAPGEDHGHGSTHDWRKPPGSPENLAGVRAPYEVMELKDALRKIFNNDAHLVTYIVIGPDGKPLKFQPRVNKSGLAWLYAQGYQVVVYTFFADLDTPGHVPWTGDLLDAALERRATNAWFDGKGHYFSRAGERIFVVLAHPIPVFCVESASYRWLTDAVKQGVPVDMKCADWTRHYRLPNVRRQLHDGQIHESRSAADCEDMRPFDATPWVRVPNFSPEVLESFGEIGARYIAEATDRYALDDPDAPAPTARKTRIHGALRWERTLSDEWMIICEAIGLVAATATIGTGHALYMPLAGALLHRGVPPELLPAIVARIAKTAGHASDDYGRLAEDTARTYAAGGNITGFPTIQKEYPEVARHLELIGLRGGPKRVADQQTKATDAMANAAPLEQVQQQIYDTIRFEQERITYIESSCGSGKTYITSRVAADRYLEASRTLTGRLRVDPEGVLGKTAITGDKHKLAIQTTNILRGFDVPVKRLFSPPTLRDARGEPVCKYEEIAKELAAGGLSVQKNLCRGLGKAPCEYLEHCAAALGYEGDDPSPIVVATHAKLRQVVAEVGPHGLLVIDEPPPLLRNEILTEEDLAHAKAKLPAFHDRYAAAIRPLLTMITGWFGTTEAGGPTVSILEIAQTAGSCVDSGELYEARIATGYDEENGGDGIDAFAVARHAIPDGEDATTAPLKLSQTIMAQRYPQLARALGRAHKTLRALYECAMGALAKDFPPKLRIEESHDSKVLRVVCPNHAYVEVLKSHNRIVILGAKADLHVREIQAVTGCEVTVYRFAAADGAPVARSILPYMTANRSMWLPHGLPIWKNGITSVIERVIAWAQEHSDVKDLCLITFRPIVVAMEATLAPKEKKWNDVWKELGLTLKSLQEARQILGPVLSLWRGTWVLGYYGGTRGMNHAQHVQAIVTLGDPRPNVDAEQVTASYMHLDGEDFVHQKAQEELEQAHGRLRAPRRTEPAWALHVGTVMPYGYGWDQAKLLSVGQTYAKPSAMSADEFRELRTKLGLTQEELAEQLGITRRSVGKYESGSKIRSGIAEVLRRLAGEST